MRAFHLLSEKHALQALRNRRLKVATYDALNDPFELLSVDVSNRQDRRDFQKWKTETSKRLGLLCFSRRWRNPLLWSHYADRHRGIALEFHIDNDLVVPVRYSSRRLRLDVPTIMSRGGFTKELAERIANTKSRHWAYEEEVRVAVDLAVCMVDHGLFFERFTQQLRIVGVVLGALSRITTHEIQRALPKDQRITFRRARLAFSSFNIARNKAMPMEVLNGTA